MSGSKRITVDESAWLTAQAAASRLRDVNRELPGMVEALRRDQQAQVDRVSRELTGRQAALEQSMAGLSEQTRRLEAATTRRLRDKTAMILSQLKDATDEIRASTRRALEDQEARLTEAIEQERDERERDMRELRQDLEGLRQDKDRVLAAARTLAADVRLIYRAIDEQLPHEQFAPGRLAAISRRLAQAEENVAQGFGEAALTQSQETYLDLSELRAEIELKDQEWQIAQIAASSAVTALLEQIRINSTIEVTDAEGKKLDGVTLDVDYWSDGELGALREKVERLTAQTAGDRGQPGRRPASADELRAIVERDAPELDAQLTDIIGRAGARQFASQVRVNLAELVVDTLEDATGFVWQEGDATYAGEDPRQAFYTKLKHADDSEIVVEVAPDDRGESCVLRILSFDAGVPDEEERARRAHVVADRLRERGLQVGTPAAEQAAPDRALADFGKLRLPAAGRRPGAATGQR